MDVELLARLQFAGTIMFHYLFPPLTIGMGLIMVIIEWAYLRTKKEVWHDAARFWTKLFALNFALGVATGIVMEFEFGTNWAAYSRFVGDVFGSALAAEGIFAFFLESGFLAVLVFGWDRVGPKMHFFSTLMVALGSIFSAIWIVVANSWQQTPAGSHVVEHEGVLRAEITDFWLLVFNPSMVDRLTHTLIGAFILGAFFVMSISAYYLLKKRHEEFARRSFTVALIVATIASLLALVTGHDQAKKVAATQPAKLAAFEGHFETGEGGAPLYLLGWPDSKAETVRFGVKIPGMLSYLVHWDTGEPIPGLKEFAEDERPPVWLPFQTYHLMVGLGMVFIGLTVVSLFFLWRKTLFTKRWLLWVWVFAVIGPFLANQSGWVAAEVGRQPWIVYPSVQDGVAQAGLRTADGLSESVTGGHVLWSIIMFGLIYALLFVIWIFVLNNKIQHGPVVSAAGAGEGGFLAAGASRLDRDEGRSLTETGDEEPGSGKGGEA